LRNYINENIYHPEKNGGYCTYIPIYVGHGGESNEGAFNIGTDQITLIGSNADVVNFYMGLDKDEIKSTGRVDINSVGIDEPKLLLGVSGKTFLKLSSYIQIN